MLGLDGMNPGLAEVQEVLSSGDLHHPLGPGVPRQPLVAPGWVPDCPEWMLFPTLCSSSSSLVELPALGVGISL